MDDVIRAMPHALGIEKALISMMLKDNLAQYPRFVESGLTLDMFYLPAHVKIGVIISQFSNKTKPSRNNGAKSRRRAFRQ